MLKSHPLTKVQLLLAIVWVVPSCVLLYVRDSAQYIVFFISIIPFIGLGVITFYLGWLMIIRKELVIYPHESFAIWLAKKTRGQKAVNKLMSIYTKPNKKFWIGAGNLFSGVFCLIIAIIGIVIMILDLQ